MNFIKYSISILILLIVNGCVSSIPLNQNLYSNGNKMGVIVRVSDITVAQIGSRGLLDIALTPGNRFKEPLAKIDSTFDFKNEIKAEVNAMLAGKGKNYEFLPDTIAWNSIGNFRAPSESKLNYADLDFRPLKERYGVDEILFVDVHYGLAVGYYGMIETGKDGFATIRAEVVRLSNNSLLVREHIDSYGKMKGNWKKDEYDNLRNAIMKAMNSSVQKMKEKF